MVRRVDRWALIAGGNSSPKIVAPPFNYKNAARVSTRLWCGTTAGDMAVPMDTRHDATGTDNALDGGQQGIDFRPVPTYSPRQRQDIKSLPSHLLLRRRTAMRVSIADKVVLLFISLAWIVREAGAIAHIRLHTSTLCASSDTFCFASLALRLGGSAEAERLVLSTSAVKRSRRSPSGDLFMNRSSGRE